MPAAWRNGGCSATYDSFVAGSSSALRLYFCAKKQPLRLAAKRWSTLASLNFVSAKADQICYVLRTPAHLDCAPSDLLN